MKKIVTDISVNGERVIFGRRWPKSLNSFENGEYDATRASLERLNKVVSRLANCEITLFEDGYEVIL